MGVAARREIGLAGGRGTGWWEVPLWVGRAREARLIEVGVRVCVWEMERWVSLGRMPVVAGFEGRLEVVVSLTMKTSSWTYKFPEDRSTPGFWEDLEALDVPMRASTFRIEVSLGWPVHF